MADDTIRHLFARSSWIAFRLADSTAAAEQSNVVYSPA